MSFLKRTFNFFYKYQNQLKKVLEQRKAIKNVSHEDNLLLRDRKKDFLQKYPLQISKPLVAKIAPLLVSR